MRPLAPPALAAAIVLACLTGIGPAKAETPTPQFLVLDNNDPAQAHQMLRMASTGSQEAVPLPGEGRTTRIARMESLETVGVAGAAGAAAVLGFIAGGASYGIAAGAAVLIIYGLLP